MSTLRRPSETTPAPTIHILGAGAVGLLHAHHLRLKSLPVTLVLRSNAAKHFRDEGEQVTVTDLNDRTLQSQGYTVEELDASPTASAVSSTKNIDICLVCTKSYQTLEAIEPLRHRFTNKSTVVLLHNAVLPIYTKLESLWNDGTRPRICLGMTTHGVRIHPGRFGLVWGGRGETLWGHPPRPNEDQNHGVADAWLSYGLAELSGTALPWPEMENRIWMKHILNTLLNPVTVLMRTPNGTLPHLHTMRPLLHTLLRPLMPLLPSSFTSDAQEVVETCLDVARKTGGNLNSMLVDVESGRRTEVRELVGFWRERLDSMRRTGSDEQWTAVEEGLKMWDAVMLMVEARGEVVRYEEVDKKHVVVK
ncbi:hypothetical protein HDU85_005710 [Gaertneriomyces sp. JEL0708]|nr:hypothetical protein HDU85_005710 [Gaertneriomyces sp. JEL0708]